MVTRQLQVRAHDRVSSPAKTGAPPTVLHNQPSMMIPKHRGWIRQCRMMSQICNVEAMVLDRTRAFVALWILAVAVSGICGGRRAELRFADVGLLMINSGRCTKFNIGELWRRLAPFFAHFYHVCPVLPHVHMSRRINARLLIESWGGWGSWPYRDASGCSILLCILLYCSAAAA